MSDHLGMSVHGSQHHFGNDGLPEMLIRDVERVQLPGESFISSADLIERLIEVNPAVWGASDSECRRDLTPHMLGKLFRSFGISPIRMCSGRGPRGYAMKDISSNHLTKDCI